MIRKKNIIQDHLEWTAGNRDTMHERCVSHTGCLAYGNSEGEIRGGEVWGWGGVDGVVEFNLLNEL